MKPDDHNQFKNVEFNEKLTSSEAKPSSMSKKVVIFVIAGLVALGSVLFFPMFLVLFGMAFGGSDGHNTNKYALMQMGYLRNKFVVYGQDDKAWSSQSKPVIFSSADGKTWDKNSVGSSPVGYNDESSRQSTHGVFIEFNQQCYLIGGVTFILISKSCDNNWEYLVPEGLIQESHESLFNAHGAIVETRQNKLYVSGDGGIYSSKDGNNWLRESLPYPMESTPKNFENIYNGIASGDNKIITSSKWLHDGKTEGLIYTYDVIKQRWSYQVMPEPIMRITRGSDRFVGVAKNTTFVLEDKLGIWRQSPKLEGELLNLLSYGFIVMNNTSYIMLGLEGLRISSNGYDWNYVKDKSHPNDIIRFDFRATCGQSVCLNGIGGTTDVLSIYSYNFNNNINQSYKATIN